MARKEQPGPQSLKQQETAALRQNKAPKPEGPRSFESLRNTIEAQLTKNIKTRPDKGKGKITTQRSQRVPNSTSSAEKGARGKKRDRNGNVLPVARAAPITNTSGSELSPSDGDEFENEVRALGGTHEDVELVADARSESDLEGIELTGTNGLGDKQKDSLEKGMSNIMREIALSQGIEEDLVQSSEEPAEKSDIVEDAPHSQANGIQQRSKSGLRCEPRPDWYAPTESQSTSEMDTRLALPSQILRNLQQYAEDLLKEENDIYKQKHQSSSSQSFYNTVITSGTLSDKISALTLAVQESPIHNKKALETLLALSKKRSRSQAVDVIRALKDLLAQGSLLPASRRLHSFATQPVLVQALGRVKSWNKGDRLPRAVTEQYLIIWAFESWLKEQYFEMLQTLEIWCNDELEFAKSKAVSYVYELLKEKPEQESNLLRLLVNKLGDPVKKIASQASYLLMQLLAVHPAMKRVVVSAIETEFIFRPGQSLHGKYYAAVTLNQTALSANEEDIAQKLLGIYFGLFSALLKTSNNSASEPDVGPKSMSRSQRRRGKKPTESGQAQTEELREKLTSALLTGVNRAYPYADSAHKSFEDNIDTLFKIAHSANFNTGVQAMLLIQQLSASHQPSNDRFYRVLYESLLDPRLTTASKHQLYLNLMHRALKADLNTRRVKAFVKRLLQVLTLHEPSFICGAFFLLKDLEASFPGLTALTDQAEEFGDDEEIFRDVDEDDGGTGQGVGVSLGESIKTVAAGKYDGHKRAPEHANADNSCAWEVLPFLAHFHPSVVVSADRFIRRASLPGKPDLTLHTLIHFLDRFVYRNGKLSESKMRGSSIMQPMASDNTHAVLLNPTSGGAQRLPVNSEAFKAKKDTDVAAEDVFFHKYFSALSKDSKKAKKRKQAATKEIESGDEDAVWQAMLNTAPELEGAEDSDEDVDMSDLEVAMGENSAAGDAEDADANESVDVEAGIFDDSDDDMGDSDGQVDMDDFGELDAEGPSSDGDSDFEEAATGTAEHTNINLGEKNKKQKLKGLPTFASADDYAKMLEDDEDEDFGE